MLGAYLQSSLEINEFSKMYNWLFSSFMQVFKISQVATIFLITNNIEIFSLI